VFNLIRQTHIPSKITSIQMKPNTIFMYSPKGHPVTNCIYKVDGRRKIDKADSLGFSLLHEPSFFLVESLPVLK